MKTLGYAIIFAFLDMFPISLYGRHIRERLTSFGYSLRSSIPTLLNIVTVMILIITVTIVAGLYVGTMQWLDEYVNKDQMARTVEISAIFGTQNVLTDHDIKQIRDFAIEGNSSPIESAFGWNDVLMWFGTADGSKDTGITDGRTVNLLDPAMKRLTFVYRKHKEKLFYEKGIAQVIVTRSLLKSLGYNKIPDYITIDYLDISAKVEIVAVAEGTPAGDFLITDEFNRAINDRTWNPNPRYDRIYLGPIVDTTIAQDQLKSLQRRLSRLKIKGKITKRLGTEEWFEFRRLRKAAWTEQQWDELLISTIKPKFGKRHEFLDPLTLNKSFDTINVGFMRASIYVKSLADVPMVVDTLSQKGYKVTNEVKQLAQLFMQVSSFGGWFLIWVMIIIGTLSAISIFLSIAQNIQRKTPEIGILKAYGASNHLIRFIYMFEGFILWFVAMLLTYVFVYPLAHLVNELIKEIIALQGSLNVSDIMVIPIELFLGIGLGAFVLVTTATFFASLVAINLQPARALSGQR